jgi:hypothetical protein
MIDPVAPCAWGHGIVSAGRRPNPQPMLEALAKQDPPAGDPVPRGRVIRAHVVAGSII